MEKHVVMDWSGVRSQDYKILLFSIPAFTLYTLLLNAVCSIGEAVITGLLFLVVQLAVGMTTTRMYYRFGNIAKERLSLLDPSTLSNGWRIEERDIHSVEVSRIFEKFYKSIKDADKKSTDDINDIAWFFIAVWSMFSTLVAVTLELFSPFCIISSGVLMSISFFNYYEGRKGRNNGYFEDDIGHLEYHVISRLEGIVALHPGAQSYVSWKIRNGTAVLNDFFVSIDLELSEKTVVKYYLGLPSKECERITIETSVTKEKVRTAISDTVGLDFSELEENRFEIRNSESNLDLRYRSSYVRTPQKPVVLFEMIKKVLKIISQ
ncbi:MAG: hypothetical protein KAR33_03950 [Candidatus Thorarchaeota archaeon]|nr:hypothetical protein [Candidatus Thorarchaeota archaeon]